MKNLNVYLFFALSLFAFSSCETEEFSTSNSSNSAITAGTVLRTSSVDQFTWIRGNSVYASSSEDRLWSSRFSFGNGGDFTYSFNWDGHTYRLYGEYLKGSGNQYAFYASRNTITGGSGTQIVVEGTIEPRSNGRYRVNMDYGSSATYAATVYNTEFFNQASKRFRTTMTMER